MYSWRPLCKAWQVPPNKFICTVYFTKVAGHTSITNSCALKIFYGLVANCLTEAILDWNRVVTFLRACSL